MAKKKKNYYVVKIQEAYGIYTNWEASRAQVLGVPGATCIGFVTKEQALEHLNIPSIPALDRLYHPESFNQAAPIPQRGTAIAYVDGSYNPIDNLCGSGVVIFHQKCQHMFSFGSNSSAHSLMKNVTGEIEASKMAIRWALDNEIKTLIIYHDYVGIEGWGNGRWNAKQRETQDYVNFCKKAKKKLNLQFIKVKAHSGDKFNNIADKVACSLTKDKYFA